MDRSVVHGSWVTHSWEWSITTVMAIGSRVPDVPPVEPSDGALAAFGAELRRWRKLRGLSQARLGEAIHVSKDLVAKIEKADRWPTPGLAARCDSVLGTEGALGAFMPAVVTARRASLNDNRRRGPADDFAAVWAATWPGARLETRDGSNTTAHIPGGVLLPGSEVSLRVLPAELGPRESVRVEMGDSPPRMLIAAAVADGRAAYFGAAPSHGRRQPDGERDLLEIPSAYRFDDLGYAVLWAVTNYDNALVRDSRALADAQSLASIRGPELPRDRLPDCTVPTQLLLGSEYCARHIVSNLDGMQATPVFWTREQRGEEAVTWLLFKHKLEYLTLTSGRSTATEQIARVFCVPEDVVESSGRSERILLLLAAALMEAHGITVHVTTEADLAELPGFATAPSGPSIVATWVRADAVWKVGTIDGSAQRREFRDASTYAVANSILDTDRNPQRRLEQFAHYLGLDWRWLRQRSRDVAAVGWAGFVRPRSEHLSVAGLDVACRYLSGLLDENGRRTP